MRASVALATHHSAGRLAGVFIALMVTPVREYDCCQRCCPRAPGISGNIQHHHHREAEHNASENASHTTSPSWLNRHNPELTVRNSLCAAQIVDRDFARDGSTCCGHGATDGLHQAGRLESRASAFHDMSSVADRAPIQATRCLAPARTRRFGQRSSTRYFS